MPQQSQNRDQHNSNQRRKLLGSYFPHKIGKLFNKSQRQGYNTKNHHIGMPFYFQISPFHDRNIDPLHYFKAKAPKLHIQLNHSTKQLHVKLSTGMVLAGQQETYWGGASFFFRLFSMTLNVSECQFWAVSASVFTPGFECALTSLFPHSGHNPYIP